MSFDRVGRTSSSAALDDWSVRGTDRQTVGKSTLKENFAPQFKAPNFEPVARGSEPLIDDDAAWEAIDPAELESAELESGELESADDLAGEDAARAALDADSADSAGADSAEPETLARAASTEVEEEATPTAPSSDAVEVGSPRAFTARAASSEPARSSDNASSAAPVATAAASTPTDPHKAPYERKTQKKTQHNAKRDRYNRDVIHHHAGNEFQISRPGVRVNGKDEMHLKGDFAYRYTITSGNKAEVVDKIWEHELQRGRETDGARLALNPSHSRVLRVNGVEVECVLSWQGGQSAAWIAIDDLRGNRAQIKRAVNRHAAKGQPKAASKAARDTAKPMIFRSVSGPADADSIDRGRYIVPGQRGLQGNQVSDYLAKKVIRRWNNADAPANAKAASGSKKLEQKLAAAGKTIQAPTGQRSMLNVMANLPHGRAASVAVDVATPGDHFFVPRGGTYRREISMYKRTKTTSNLRQTWVYGFIGKLDANGTQVADASRRGWVPLRVLKSA